jgi:hypothetical protein
MFTASLIAAAALTAASLLTAPAAYAQNGLTPLLQINPVNAAAASNSDDDVVVQSNSATVKQDADVKCDAKVSDNDKVRVGDNNNIAANECEAENESTVAQANVNSDDDVQVAEATACQALGLIAGVNLCDTTIDIDLPDGPPEEDGVWCVTHRPHEFAQPTVCFSSQEECEGFSEAIQQPPYSSTIIEPCQEFEEPPTGADCAVFEGSVPVQSVPCSDLT